MGSQKPDGWHKRVATQRPGNWLLPLQTGSLLWCVRGMCSAIRNRNPASGMLFFKDIYCLFNKKSRSRWFWDWFGGLRTQAFHSLPLHLLSELGFVLMVSASWLQSGCCSSRHRILIHVQRQDVEDKAKHPNGLFCHQAVCLPPSCKRVGEISTWPIMIRPVGHTHRYTIWGSHVRQPSGLLPLHSLQVPEFPEGPDLGADLGLLPPSFPGGVEGQEEEVS